MRPGRSGSPSRPSPEPADAIDEARRQLRIPGMTDSADGYRTDIDYIYSYYTELNPLRLRLALLNAGLKAPAVTTACELGFGQGVSLGIHAAASAVRLARHGHQSGACRLRPGTCRGFGRRSRLPQRLLRRFFQARPADVRLHRPARRLELDLRRQSRGDRGLHPAPVEAGRRPLHGLQRPARLGGLLAVAPSARRTREPRRQRGHAHRRSHRRGHGLRRSAAGGQPGLCPRQPRSRRQLQGPERGGSSLPGARILQPRLAADALR